MSTGKHRPSWFIDAMDRLRQHPKPRTEMPIPITTFDGSAIGMNVECGMCGHLMPDPTVVLLSNLKPRQLRKIRRWLRKSNLDVLS